MLVETDKTLVKLRSCTKFLHTLLKCCYQNPLDLMPMHCSFGDSQRNMKRNLMKMTIGILLYKKNHKQPLRKQLPFFGQKANFLSRYSELFGQHPQTLCKIKRLECRDPRSKVNMFWSSSQHTLLFQKFLYQGKNISLPILEQSPLLRFKSTQNPVSYLTTHSRPINPNSEPIKVGTSKFLNNAFEPIVPSSTSSKLQCKPSRYKVDLIMYHQDIFHLNLVKPHQWRYRLSWEIHIGLRLAEENLLPSSLS